MNSSGVLIFYIAFAVIGAIFTGWLFTRKGRSRWLGVIIGGVISLLLSFLALIVVDALLWFLLPNTKPGTTAALAAAPLAPGVPLPTPAAVPPVMSASSIPAKPTGVPAAPIVARAIGHGQNKVFISYRRDDSAEVTGRIYDALVEAFGLDVVFKDIENIPYGIDFRDNLQEAVAKCTLLIAVIGDKWLTITNSKGIRRLDDPGDFVRIEIEHALDRKIPVIPLLVKGASMPSEASLPDAIKRLAYRNAAQARNDPDFHADMERLVKSIQRTWSV